MKTTSTSENQTENNPEIQQRAKRAYQKRGFIEFPRDEFTPAGLAAQLGVPTYTINNNIRKLRDKFQLVGTLPSTRGKKKPVYKMI